MTRSRKPSVFQVGKVRDDGRTVVISGWGLGLATYAEGGCDCCEPWTADELAAILRDFSSLSALDSEPLAG